MNPWAVLLQAVWIQLTWSAWLTKIQFWGLLPNVYKQNWAERHGIYRCFCSCITKAHVTFSQPQACHAVLPHAMHSPFPGFFLLAQGQRVQQSNAANNNKSIHIQIGLTKLCFYYLSQSRPVNKIVKIKCFTFPLLNNCT